MSDDYRKVFDMMGFGNVHDPWSRQSLEQGKGAYGVGSASKGPRVLRSEQDADGKWWGNKPQYGPFDTAEELRIAVFGEGGDWIVGG
jgi:hypothetical protein